MRILLSVEHPAWAHQFRYVIKELENKGHTIKVVAINKDHDLELLDAFGIPYEVISDSSGKNIVEKGLIFLSTTIKIFFISHKYKPDLFFGRASPMMAINSFLFRKPHIVFEDTEHSEFCLTLCSMFSDVIITPNSFKKWLGDKHLKINSFKELFYLHPNYLQLNDQVLVQVKIKPQERFFILRFIAWDAHHDVGQSGIENKERIIRELEKYGKVLITSETSLPQHLLSYKIDIPFEKLHDLLYFTSLYFGEGSTTATESAILGTPSIYISSLTGKMGNLIDLEKKFGLLFSFKNEQDALDKAVEIVQQPQIKEEWQKKRDVFLKNVIDPTKFMVWFIETYPLSFDEMKLHSGLQCWHDQLPTDAL